MSLRGAQGSLRRGFARMVKPLKSGLTSSRSREEELRDEREFERLFLLFEAFLHTDRSRPASPSSSPSPAADVDLPLPLRQFVGGRSDSDDHHANGDGDDEMKSKRRRRLSFGRERRKSVSKKKSEDDKKNEDDGHGSQAPKAVAIAAELGVGEDGDNNNNKQKKNEDGDETRQPAKGKNEDGGGGAEEEHEVRFVVGLLNGYLALKRLGAGDKDLTFSLAHNKKKEEERERRELEKLRGEVVLRMTSALADLGALPAAATDAGSAQLSASAAARPSGVARHQSTDYRIPASRSSPMMTKHNRTSWRGRLRSKEKEKKAAAAAVSVEEQQQAGGKDKKPQQPDSEERSGSTAQKSEENAKNESHDWRDRFLSPRSQHKRSQSLTFEPQGVKTMSIDVLVADDDDDSDDWHDSEPRIPLAELEERLCRMEELIERKFAKQHPAMEAQSAAELKKSKRRSLNQLLRRSTNKITGHKDRKDTIDKANKADDDDNDDDGEDNEGEATDLGDEGSGIYAIPASIYTKVTNRRRSVYHYNLDSIREMIHQHHQHQHHTTTKSDGDHDQPQPALPEENEARDGGKSEGKNEDGKGEGESDDVMQGTPVKIVFTAPSSPPVPTLNLNQDEGFLSPDAPKATPLLPPPCHVSVSSTATSAFASSSPSTSTKTATSTTTESEAAAATTAARNWRRTVHDKRDKMLRMRVMDSKFAGQAKNVKRAFLWCEENVAPVTLVKVVKAQAFAKRFLARRLRKRLQIANELLVTEKHYVDILDLLVKVFLQPLREGDLLPPESILAIFGNTETLRDKHVLFHELLHKRVRDWMTFQQFGVGDIFYDHTDFLLGYTEYVNNFDKALAMLTRCTKSSPEFALFVRNCEARPECNLHDLPSLLITPVQRIPRYTLLLQDLQRHTPSGSRPGLLEMALKKVKDIANYINEQKRANENELKMAELDSRLVFDPKPKIGLCEVPARKFIKEGKVLIQLGRKHFKECHVFLFTDLLLITKNEDLDDNDEEAAKEKEAEPKRNDVADEHHPSGKLPRYLVKAAEPLNENPIEISPLPPFFLDKATRFPLRLYFSSQRKEYRCVFASQNERDDWLQRIVSAHASARRRPYSILSVRRGFTATSAGAHQGQPPAL